MAEQTFRINVVIDPSDARGGAQSVRRELTQLNATAATTQNLLKRAFAVVGIEEGIRAIVGLIDAYTKLQNRIRVVVQNNEILGEVTQRVFDIANRSRSSFESTAELFSRVALATRDLGVSENELLGITESVNKAIILSGASAKEANNGLIQLSQGLASNRLGGDELRAVLEQLPVVADVIAKQLGLTRGQLRIFSREGNISAKTVLDAFKNAREELEKRFAKTIPTIGQALQLLRNSLVSVVGDIASTAGVSNVLARAITLLAQNLSLLVKLFAVFGSTLLAAKLSPFIGEAVSAAAAARELATAVAAGNAVLLGSAEAARQAAAFEVEQASASAAKTEATLAAIVATREMAVVDLSASEAARANAVADVEGAAAYLRRAEAATAAAEAENAALLASASSTDVLFAANVQTAELVASRQTLVAATQELAIAQDLLASSQAAANLTAAAEAASGAQLAAVQAALVTETETLVAAQAELAVAEGAVAAESGLLSGVIATVTGAVRTLWAAIAANPLGALLIGLAAVGTALFVFRNDIKVSGDGFATLGDLSSAYFDLFKGGLASIRETFGEVFGFIGSTIDSVFGKGTATLAGFLRAAANAADFLLGLTQGPLLAAFALITDLPAAAADLGIQLINVVLRVAQQIVAGFSAAFSTVLAQADKFFSGLLTGFQGLGTAFSAAISGDFSGAAEAATAALSSALGGARDALTTIPATFATEFQASLGEVFQVNNSFVGEAEALGNDVGASFVAGFKSSATLDFVNEIIADAEDKARERREAAARAAGELNTRGAAVPTVAPALVKITRELQDQEQLLSLVNKTNTERKVESDLLRIKNELITQGAAQASQQLSQVDQQIAQLRQKAAVDGADVRTIQLQIGKLVSLRQSVIDKTKADRADFDTILDGLRIQLLANDSLQAQVDLLDQLRGQQEQAQRKTDAANAAFERGAITGSEYARALRQIAEEARGPIDQAFRQIEQQNDLLAITRDTNAARETEVALQQQLQQLAQQGEKLSPSQEGKLARLIAENQALQRQQDLVSSVPLTQAKADELLVQKIGDLDAAYARGALTLEQYVSGLEQANQATLTLSAQAERDLRQQNDVLRVIGATNAEREHSVALLQAEQALRNQGVTLGSDEKQRLSALLAENEALQRQATLIESITPVASKVQQQYAQDLQDVTAAFQRGAINGEQYAQALDDIRLKAAESGHTLEDGFTRASIKIQESIRDMATVTEQSLTSAFNSAEGALNDFVNKGTVDVRALAQSLVADFTKIISHLLILQATEGLGLVKEKAGTGLDAGAAALNPASAALDVGATTLATASASLNAGSLSLTTGATGLDVGATTLSAAAAALGAAVPGLAAVAAQLTAAAAALGAAGAVGGASAFATQFAQSGGLGLQFFAAGGDALANQPMIVGEQGPELFVPRNAGTIIPHEQTVNALAGGGSGAAPQVIVNVPTPQVHVEVQNHIDSGAVVEHGLASRRGEQAFVKTTSKNKSATNKALGR